MVKIPVGSRKIQKSTNRSYFLNLPLWWVNQLGLSKGDKIDIYRDKSGNLLLKPNLEFKAIASVTNQDIAKGDKGNSQILSRLAELTGLR